MQLAPVALEHLARVDGELLALARDLRDVAGDDEHPAALCPGRSGERRRADGELVRCAGAIGPDHRAVGELRAPAAALHSVMPGHGGATGGG